MRFFSLVFGLICGALGLAFVLAGAHNTLSTESMATRLFAVIFLLFGLAIISVGLGTLTIFAYDLRSGDTGVSVSFVFRKEFLTWDRVQWYRTFPSGFGRAVDNTTITERLWVFFSYRSRASVPNSRFAVAIAQGVGPAFSPNAVRTLFDDFVPSRRRTGKRVS